MLDKVLYENKIEEIDNKYSEYDFFLEFVIKSEHKSNKIPKGMSKCDFNNSPIVEIGLTILHKNPQQMKCIITNGEISAIEWAEKVCVLCEELRSKRGK